MIICLSLSPETKASSLGSNQAPDIRGFSYPVQSLINADREEMTNQKKTAGSKKIVLSFFSAAAYFFSSLPFIVRPL